MSVKNTIDLRKIYQMILVDFFGDIIFKIN